MRTIIALALALIVAGCCPARYEGEHRTEGNVHYQVWQEGRMHWRAMIAVLDPSPPHHIVYDTIIDGSHSGEVLTRMEAWRARHGLGPCVHITEE